MCLQRRYCSIVFFLILLSAVPALAGVNRFVEDFSTTTYQDASNTTAWWTTPAGVVKLWSHNANEVYSISLVGIKDVAIDGPSLYIVANQVQIHWFEISPARGGGAYASAVVLTDARGLDVVGNYVYVADGSAGLTILNAETLTLVGTLATAGAAEQVEVVGDLAYVAVGNSGLEIIDVASPAAPVLVGSYNTSGIATGLDVEGNYCYLADFNGGLKIIDVSAPATPFQVASFPTGGNAPSVVVKGNVAYVSDFANGLVAVDISDPTSPSLLNNLSGVDGRGLAVTGDFAYLGRSTDILQIEISDPSSLNPYNNAPTGGSAIFNMDTDGEYLYLCDEAGDKLRILEIREPSPVEVVDSVDPGRVFAVEVRGDVLYGAGTDFYSMDVSDPTALVPLDTLVVGGFMSSLDVEGDFAYVSRLGNMTVIDVSDPSSLTVVGGLAPAGSVFMGGVEVEGDLCLVGSDSGLFSTLWVLDVSDPTSPVVLSSTFVAGQARSIAIEGTTAFVAMGADGLVVLDISDPLNPSVLANWTVIDNASSVLAEGTILYMAAELSGVYIRDVTNPASANTPGFVFADGSFTNGLARTGTYLFTSADGDGLRMYDVADPAAPVELEYGYGHNATTPRGVTAAGEYVYQATLADGVDVLRVMASDFELEKNEARSTNVNTAGSSVLAARLSSERTGAAEWSLSVDGGSNWESYPTEGVWHEFVTSGFQMKWNVALVQDQAGINPTLDSIQLDMAFEFPIIQDVEDIANDQGKQVRVRWQFSAFDMPGSGTPILNYAVYRSIDPNLSSSPGPLGMESPEGLGAAPAGWDFVGLIPATVEDEYSLVVPTLADSTIDSGDYLTSFYVRALTGSPETYFDSPPDSGYSVDNLAPGAPQAFAATYTLGEVALSWNEAPEEDFQYFRVYRDTDPAFVPGPGTLVYETSATSWQDSPPDPGSVFYKVTALDFSGNESLPAGSGSVTAVGGGYGTPTIFALRGAMPNPIHSGTRIAFDLPREASVSLEVLDVTGRLVRTLSGENMPAGSHEISWDGADHSGQRVAAGVYLYRLRAGSFEATRRMVVIR